MKALGWAPTTAVNAGLPEVVSLAGACVAAQEGHSPEVKFGTYWLGATT
jgi:hypothetical protein